MAGVPSPRFFIEPLSRSHDRTSFSCGVDSLNRYLKNQAGQDLRRRIAATFVATFKDEPRVWGYYTLSAYAIDPGALPAPIQRRMPRYPLVPATLLGRLAVDQEMRRRGLGEFLLVDALRRSLLHSAEVASTVVVVDAIDESAHSFYRRFDFEPLPDHPRRLFLPMAAVEEAHR